MWFVKYYVLFQTKQHFNELGRFALKAFERVEKALQYSYRDGRNKKRDMRSIWIEGTNAGTREGTGYVHWYD